jgi:hypothetical protein
LSKDGGCDCEDDQLMQIYNAMIRFFFKENPDELSDMDFVSRQRELMFLSDNGFLRGIKL